MWKFTSVLKPGRKHLAVTAGYQKKVATMAVSVPTLLKLNTKANICSYIPLWKTLQHMFLHPFRHSTDSNHNDYNKLWRVNLKGDGFFQWEVAPRHLAPENLLVFTPPPETKTWPLKIGQSHKGDSSSNHPFFRGLRLLLLVSGSKKKTQTLTTRGPLTPFSSTCHFQCGRRSWCGQQDMFENRSHGNVKQNSGINPFPGNNYWILRNLLRNISQISAKSMSLYQTSWIPHNTETMR